MAYDSFNIKYLFELYPDLDFEETFVIKQTVTELTPDYESQATSEAWGLILDSIHSKRLIQTYKKRHYEVTILLSRNIDAARLAVGYVTLTTQAGETFAIYDVKTTFEKTLGSLNYKLTLDFYRYDDDIINHLSSENAYNLKISTVPATDVNEIGFDVIKPSYAVRVNITSTGLLYTFTIDKTAELSNILVTDYYYGHVKDSSFDNQTHYLLDVTAVSATEITFEFNGAQAVSFGYADIVINQEKGELPYSASVVAVTHSFIIYGFINPKILNKETPTEGISTEDGINENQKYNNKRVAKFKIWLTTADLYKIEFLNYAKVEDIKLTLADTTEYIPCQVQNIYKYVPKDLLIDLHEYDIELLYLNKTVNLNR